MPRSKTTDEGPHPVDIYVGNKVKNRRLTLDLSQDDLAKACGITFQQVQKYERGTNRISLSRLAEISYALKTQLEYFTEGCMSHLPGASKPALRGFSDTKQAAFESDGVNRDEMELLRAYKNISTPKLKKQLVEMAKAMAQTGNDD
jgi:transcriptional regulator with XRE-family HTH domain